MLDHPRDRVISSFLEGCVLVESGTVSRMNHRRQGRVGGNLGLETEVVLRFGLCRVWEALARGGTQLCVSDRSLTRARKALRLGQESR